MFIRCEYTFLPYDEFRKHTDKSYHKFKEIGGIEGISKLENPKEELHMVFCQDCRDHLKSLDPKNRN
jgi:hypothetical protein